MDSVKEHSGNPNILQILIQMIYLSGSTKWLKFLVDFITFNFIYLKEKGTHHPNKKKNMGIEKETEEKIFTAAQEVFHKKGFDGARMQEIADEAEINKSMLHYYYRSKDKLFMAVFQAGIKKILPKLLGVLGSDKTLEEKVIQIVDFYYFIFNVNPHLPSFVIHEMNMHPERFQEFIASTHVQIPQKFRDQVQVEVTSGRMMEITPEQFLINIVSLCMMPVIAKKMVQVIFSFDESEYSDFLKERKKIIPSLIMNGVKPS